MYGPIKAAMNWPIPVGIEAGPAGNDQEKEPVSQTPAN
jgi:hypothetical protein